MDFAGIKKCRFLSDANMRSYLVSALVCISLSACGKGGPLLENIGQKSPIQSGDSIQVSCGVKNSGQSFKGLKISLSGDAFDKNLVSAPTTLPVELWDMSATPKKRVTASFVANKDRSWVAELPDLEVDQPSICFDLSMPASLSGSGNFNVIVGALDGTGTNAVFRYACTVDSMLVARAREQRSQAQLQRIRDSASPPATLSSLTSSNLKVDPDFGLRMQAERARALEIQSRRTFNR